MLDVMDQPHAATHLRAAGVKKQSTHVSRSHREQRDSAGLMQDDKGIIMKHSCCFTTDLD